MTIATRESFLVLIGETSFVMGSAEGRDDERPEHRVRLQPFAMGAWQVTNGEYDLFLAGTGHPPPPFRDDPRFDGREQPVVGVSWYDANLYCQWRSQASDRRVRLPTEAEWECAARGGAAGMLYPWGNSPPQSRPDYEARWNDGPERRSELEPNGYGLFAMCENVHEWCSDWYDAGYYAVSPEDNPRGPECGSRRVSRGGSWRHQIRISRCAARSSLRPDLAYTDYGFRIASDVP